MAKRPKFLTAIAWIFAGIALSFPIQAMSIYGHGLSEWEAIVNKISLLNFIVIGLATIQIPLVLRASRWLFASLPLMLTAVAWNNHIVAFVGNDVSPMVTHFATGLFASFSLFLFYPPLFRLLQHPKKRWWLTAPRKQVRLPVQISPLKGQVFNTETFDLSQTGIFISFSDHEQELVEMHPGDEINLRICLGSLRRLACQAQVVRNVQAKGHYPAGIGLQFVDMDREERQALKRFLDSQSFAGPRDGPTPSL